MSLAALQCRHLYNVIDNSTQACELMILTVHAMGRTWSSEAMCKWGRSRISGSCRDTQFVSRFVRINVCVNMILSCMHVNVMLHMHGSLPCRSVYIRCMTIAQSHMDQAMHTNFQLAEIDPMSQQDWGFAESAIACWASSLQETSFDRSVLLSEAPWVQLSSYRRIFVQISPSSCTEQHAIRQSVRRPAFWPRSVIQHSWLSLTTPKLSTPPI